MGSVDFAGTDEALAALVTRSEEIDQRIEELQQEKEMLDAMLENPKVRQKIERLRDTNQSLFTSMFAQQFDAENIDDEPVWKVAIYVLRREGQPLELEDLAEKIIEAGEDFGGGSPPKSLAAYISKHPEHLQQKGGKAYLTDWL